MKNLRVASLVLSAMLPFAGARAAQASTQPGQGNNSVLPHGDGVKSYWRYPENNLVIVLTGCPKTQICLNVQSVDVNNPKTPRLTAHALNISAKDVKPEQSLQICGFGTPEGIEIKDVKYISPVKLTALSRFNLDHMRGLKPHPEEHFSDFYGMEMSIIENNLRVQGWANVDIPTTDIPVVGWFSHGLSALTRKVTKEGAKSLIKFDLVPELNPPPACVAPPNAFHGPQ